MKLFFSKYIQTFLAVVTLLVSHSVVKASNSDQAGKTTRKIVVTPKILKGKIIYSRNNGMLWMMDPITRREQIALKNPFSKEYWEPFAAGVAFSPDLQHVALVHKPSSKNANFPFRGNELFIVNIGNGACRKLTNTNVRLRVQEPRFSPDGTRIVYVRRTGMRSGGPGYTGMEIRVVNADGSGDRHIVGDVNDLSQSYFSAFWSRDGKKLLYTHYSGNIDYEDEGRNKRELEIYDLESKIIQSFDGNYSTFHRPDVSPDGDFLSVIEPLNPDLCSWSLKLRLYTSQKQYVRDLVRNSDLFMLNSHWSQDNKRIAFEATQYFTKVARGGRASEERVTGIWIVGADAKNLNRLSTDTSLIAWL